MNDPDFFRALRRLGIYFVCFIGVDFDIPGVSVEIQNWSL